MSLPFTSNPLQTRADVQQLVRDLAEPVVSHFSEGRAFVRLGENRGLFGDKPGWLEGFARPLWGLVPLAAGGGKFEHWDLWQQGVASGVDPKHPEYWGLPGDLDQRSVEQAAFGFALALAPEHLWKPLSAETRQNLTAWLSRINEVKLVNSNWLFFRVLVNLGLSRCGQPSSTERVDADLAKIDEFYLGDGWYSDGPMAPPYRDGRTGDYYIAMAFHFYSLIYARLAPDHDPSRASRLIERARLFARDFAYYFSGDGAAIPFGRSLTYRFAQGAFWGGLAYAGVEALPWGVIKGLYLRHLRWWMSQPIFSDTGLLTIGYGYPNLHMQESYNSSGSPYWAMKAFLPLALPETHPFWRAEEMPLPPRRSVQTIANAKLIFCTDSRSRETVAITPGQPVLDWPRNAPHKYSKCAYSTRFAFNVPVGPATIFEGGLDNVISVSEENRFFRVREQCEDAEVREGVGYSRWQPWPGVTLRSWIVALEDGAHARIHLLSTQRRLWSVDGGFPAGYSDKATFQTFPSHPNGPAVRTPRGRSMMRNLAGDRTPECVDLGVNSSLLHSMTAMPFLRGVHEAGEHRFASWVGFNSDPADEACAGTAYAVVWENASVRLTRGGEAWWSWSAATPICGESSPARLAQLASVV